MNSWSQKLFDPKKIRRAVELQKKSYALLKWVNENLKRGSLDFSVAHEAMSAADAAAEWIGRHLENIPPDVRPKMSELKEFGCLFASYLTTSFELKKSPGVRPESSYGCYCMCCSYLVAADQLQVRNPRKKSKKDALELKRVYLQSLMPELGITAAPRNLDSILNNSDLSESLSLATYAHELIRRTEFASQGIAVLVLWRDIAWEEGRPNKDFHLSADGILEAEARLIEEIRGAV